MLYYVHVNMAYVKLHCEALKFHAQTASTMDHFGHMADTESRKILKKHPHYRKDTVRMPEGYQNFVRGPSEWIC